MSHRIVVTSCLVICVFAIYISILSMNLSGHPYNKLAVGMTISEVEGILKSPLDHVYKYDDFSIHYYRSPSVLIREPTKISENDMSGKNIGNLGDLPDIYGYYQLAFDSNGVLCAYTWIGETYTVESMTGSVKGSHLSKLVHLP